MPWVLVVAPLPPGRYDGYLTRSLGAYKKLLCLVKLYNHLPVHFLWETLPLVMTNGPPGRG
jgi:hypothetical protein